MNKLVDLVVHGDKPCKDLGTMIVDEGVAYGCGRSLGLTSSCGIILCRWCGKLLSEQHYVGANLAMTKLYYLCPRCKNLTRVERRGM